MTGDGRVPKISVVTVVRNGSATLRRTIESTLRCLGSAAEYIIIDGASTDGTVEIIEAYASRLSFWVSEPDKGIYDAMNKAMTHARGQWVYFLGADDELEIPFDTLLESMTDMNSVYYGDVIVTTSGNRSAGKFNKYRLMQENICHQAIFYPRSVFTSRRYSTDVGMLADHKYNIELWGSGIRFKYIDAIIARFNDQGASNNAQRSFERLKLSLIREQFGYHFYLMKKIRSAAVLLLKGRHEPA